MPRPDRYMSVAGRYGAIHLRLESMVIEQK